MRMILAAQRYWPFFVSFCCARLYVRYFTYTVSFYPHGDLVRDAHHHHPHLPVGKQRFREIR